MTQLPLPLVCLTLEHVIDEPDAVESYLATDSEAEKCIPIIIRRLLTPAAQRYDLSPSSLTTDMLLRILRSFWSDEDINDINDQLYYAIDYKAMYLIPFLLESGAKFPFGVNIRGILFDAAKNDNVDMVKVISNSMMKTNGVVVFRDWLMRALVHAVMSNASRTIQYILQRLSSKEEQDQYFKQLNVPYCGIEFLSRRGIRGCGLIVELLLEAKALPE